MDKKIRRPKFERVSPDERRTRLIEASIACLAKGGIQSFTVDNICREAGTSRGLIAHHFGSKDALLAAVYATVYGRVLDTFEWADLATPSIESIVETVFAESFLSRQYLNVWLALWGEIAVNPALQLEHRKHYALYRERVARLISGIARSRGVVVDSYDVATIFISLVDGLWLEQCIDSSQMSLLRARELCRQTLSLTLSPARQS